MWAGTAATPPPLSCKGEGSSGCRSLGRPGLLRPGTAPPEVAVAPEQLLADPQCVARLDCKAVSVEEVRAIRNDLNFKSTKEGICHGFCLWFTVQFSSPHGVVELSTAPGAEPTHWAQTVILLPEMLMAQPGNHIPCKIEMRPAEDNPRHCVVALELP